MSTPRDWRPGFEQQTARINVDDDTWRLFRQHCLGDGEHVSVALGRLVDAEVNRRRPTSRGPAVDKPAPKSVNASTREQATRKPAEPRQQATSASAAATTSTPTLFD